MWQNIKYYVMAYAIVIAGTVVSTGLELLPGLFPEFGLIQKAGDPTCRELPLGV